MRDSNMKNIKIKKSWDFKIAGKPSDRLIVREPKLTVASVADQIPFIKPRLLVKTGDSVNIGSVLFEDKINTELKFLSPAGGSISAFNYGPRRVLKEIIITIDDNEKFETFESFDQKSFNHLSRNVIISKLMAGGMWPLIRQLPFRQVADPDVKPPAVWVMLGSSDPFQPSFQIYLKDHLPLFKFGITVLQKIVHHINICSYGDDDLLEQQIKRMVTHRAIGGFPASDPGVVVYHTKRKITENNAWYIDGQDVINLGKFFMTGKYPIERIIAFSDGSSENSCHIKTRIGIQFDDLYPLKTAGHYKKWISNGILSGFNASPQSFLGLYEKSVMIVEEARQSEFFGFLQPGLKKLSHSRSVLSTFFSTPLPVISGMNGDVRPCINCGYCSSICPVDILPQFTFKSLYVDEIEEALSHGLLDCVECGLCSFVCPSKIELTESLIKAKHIYRKEIN